MKKHKKKKRGGSGGLVLIVAGAIALIAIIILSTRSKPISVTRSTTQPAAKVVWKSTSLSLAYQGDPLTNDIVGDTLTRLDQLYDFLIQEIPGDTNLMRLTEKERTSRPTREQLEIDLGNLRGMKIDYIGQYHESMDSQSHDIKSIQREIAEKIRDHYDVIWTEDFAGGKLITAENAWKYLIEEGNESDLPALKAFNNEADTKAYIQRVIPLHASFQFLFNPTSNIEVRGADYHPVKAIQQRFMEYLLPLSQRGSPPPRSFTANEQTSITTILSDARNIFILRQISLQADRTKRNVLVVGAFHANHLAYLMKKYGVESTFTLPEE